MSITERSNLNSIESAQEYYTDNAYAGGRIGTAIQSDTGSASDAAFTHLMLWA